MTNLDIHGMHMNTVQVTWGSPAAAPARQAKHEMSIKPSCMILNSLKGGKTCFTSSSPLIRLGPPVTTTQGVREPPQINSVHTPLTPGTRTEAAAAVPADLHTHSSSKLFRHTKPSRIGSMEGAGPHRRLDVLTRQLTRAAVDEPALLQQEGPDLMACPKALQAVLLHDNGALRHSIYESLKVGC